jgi:HK97 family phage major capsid protein
MPYLSQNIGAEEWATFVLDGLSREAVVLAAGARRIVTSAKTIHVPVPAAASTAWYAELQEINEDDAAPEEVELTPRKVANLSVASNEAVGDASVDVLDTIGDVAVRAVALEVDRALLNGIGTGNQPRGLLRLAAIPKNPALDVTYAGLVTAAGAVRATGGRPNVAFISPVDHTALALATDAGNRPLLQGTADAPVEVIGGMRLWPTPAVPSVGLAACGSSTVRRSCVRN